MKQITVHIPDNKYSLFMDLLKTIDYAKVEEDLAVSEEQKNIVRKRSKLSDEDPSRLLDWENAKNQIKF